MRSLGFRIGTLLLLAALATTALPRPAVGQESQSDLRRENQRLLARVTDLERELAAAQEELKVLRAELAALRQQLAAPGGAPAAPPAPADQPVTIDESKPDASPRALLKAIKADYQETTKDLELGQDTGDPKRVAYLRTLQRWAGKANRTYRMPIQWHVRIVSSAVPVGRGYLLRLQAVDPKTEVELGDPFDAVLPRSVASRLQEMEQRRGLDDVLLLKGVIAPRVVINEEREVVGAFDNPRFIGPYAEFGFDVQTQTIVLAPDAAEEEAAGNEGDSDAGSSADSDGG
jgi:hypothetical protein